MAAQQELQVQQKREIETKEESTVPARTYVPTADIFEAQDALRVVLEMPGVEKTNIDVTVQEGVLNVRGRLDFSKYKNLQSTPSTTSVIMREASGFQARLIIIKSEQS